MAMLVVKADGTQEPFDRTKLQSSLRRAGASETEVGDIVQQVEAALTPNMPTALIYRNAFALMRRMEAGTAARYSLKRAILEFGPSGFPFEAYLAEVFRTEGYQAATNTMGKGTCVEHEIDVLIEKGGTKTYVEAKFHNAPGFKTDLKVVLYVQARIEDLQKRDPGIQGLVATNTKFTDMAVRYAGCAGLPLLGWDYPEHASLQQMIERSGLYPVTALTTLSRKEKIALLSQKVVLCNGLMRRADALRGLGLSSGRHGKLAEEVGALCQTYGTV